MYYMYPKNNAAYEVKNQFMFGSELMVAPITQPNNKITQLGSTEVWLPKGDWFDFFSGVHYTSKAGRTLSVHRKINDYPVFAKSGAIVPLQNAYALEPGNDLQILIFPGKDNQFTLYEDAGGGSEFENGEFVKTEMTLEWSENPVFTVKPAQGTLSLLPKMRNYQFILRGYNQNISVKVMVDGKETESVTTYDETTNSILLDVTADATSDIKLMICGESLITDNGDVLKRCSSLMQKAYFDARNKRGVMTILEDSELSLRKKISKINFRCAMSVEHQDLIEALIEQLTLVEE